MPEGRVRVSSPKIEEAIRGAERVKGTPPIRNSGHFGSLEHAAAALQAQGASTSGSIARTRAELFRCLGNKIRGEASHVERHPDHAPQPCSTPFSRRLHQSIKVDPDRYREPENVDNPVILPSDKKGLSFDRTESGCGEENCRQVHPGRAISYELFSERCRSASLIVVSNRTPNDWYALFPNPVLAEGALDRLINSSHYVLMEGKELPPAPVPRPRAGADASSSSFPVRQDEMVTGS
ncbi:MAG: ATP-binding protein [Clostridia bacterium]